MLGLVLNQRYRLESELGQGAMGLVYRAHDNLLRRDVAVKVISKTKLGTEGRSRLLHEARAAAGLNHPNIVAVHDAGEADGLPFIVMELVAGHSLHTLRPSDCDEVIAIARQICAALDHAHGHGVIHRDLKPENVIVSHDGTAKLTDFGLARSVASRLSSEGLIVGTVFYLAPELARGKEFDGRADLYALGVILYELTTGQMPFTAEDPLAVISQHLHAPVVPPRAINAEIPLALEALILRLLAKEPADRLPSAAAVLADLKRIDAASAELQVRGELSVLDRIVRGTLVARERELEEINALWRSAVSGEGQVLLVSGEPGIGKTRLLREMATRVEVSNGRVVTGECYAEGGPPFAPLAQVIRGALQGRDDLPLPPAVLVELLALSPDLRPNYADLPSNPPLDSEGERQRLFESVATLFRTLTGQSPVLFFLDDAHWADSGTLHLLLHLARQMRAQRLMIAATYREVELDETRPFLETLHELNRERLATRLKLARLDREGTRKMLATLLAEEITSEFLDGVYRETEGNPFFIEEVVKALVEEGKLAFKDGRWHRPGMQELDIPQSVHLAVQTRVNKLPSEAREVLQLASVFGREFDYETLRQVSDLQEEALIHSLEYAERAQLIAEVHRKGSRPGATALSFSFAHALIPASLYSSLSGLRRRRLHHRAALALERQYPDQLEELAPSLGRHFAEAGESEHAQAYLLKAGDRARSLYAYQEAIHAYQQALGYLRENGDNQQAARTLMKLGLLYHTLFDYPRSRQAYQEGFALWQRTEVQPATIPRTPAPHPLRIPVQEPPTLDPTLAVDSSSANFIRQLFSGLVELSPEMEIMPGIARNWEMLAGGRRYVFHLRQDFHWSDGTPVTAQDFEYAWKRVLDPATQSAAAEWLFDVKGAADFHRGENPSSESVGVHTPDRHTLVVELEEPTGYFLHLMAYHTTFPVPNHMVEKYGQAWTDPEHLVTNGSFRLEEWRAGESLALVRNPDFPGQRAGNLERVETVFLKTWSNNILALYEADELDMAGGLPPQALDRARQRHAGEYLTGPEFSTQYVGFNLEQAPFNDPRVRQAFVMAVDREYLANVIMHGYTTPGLGGFVPPGLPGHSEGIGLPYDPGRARQLLAQAGFPSGEGFPKIEALSFPWEDPVREFLQTQWRETLGVEMRWKTLKWGRFIERLRQELPNLFLLGWSADYPDPDTFLRVPLSNYYGLNWNPSYGKLVEAARRMTDQGQRIERYQQADRILMEEAALIPISYGQGHLLVKPWVKQIPLSPIVGVYLKDVIVEGH